MRSHSILRPDLKLLGSIAALACFVATTGYASANPRPAGKPVQRAAKAAPQKILVPGAPQYLAPQQHVPQAVVHPAHGALHDPSASHKVSGAALFAGCYAGVHGSAMRNDVKTTERHPDYASVPQQKFVMNTVGFGVQLGCNFVQNDMVFGAEAEGMFPLTSRGEATYMKFGNTMETNLLTANERASYALSLRAGIVADRTLFYAKLGFAQTAMRLDQRYEHGTFVNKTQFTDYTRLNTSGGYSKLSYMFGGGAEYAIDANWSVKGEYNLIVTPKDELVASQSGEGVTRTTVSDGNGGFDSTNTPITGATRVKNVSNMRNVFKIGVNRRF